MRGAFGETDLDKKVIRVNKKLHKTAKKHKKSVYNIPKKDISLINTMVHEKLHAKHPKMTERAIRKKTRTVLAKMGTKAKKKVYRQFQYQKA